MILTHKYRLWVNANQRRELDRTLETHRRLYNFALDGRMLCWEAAAVRLSYVDQTRWFVARRRSNEYFKTLNVSSAYYTLRKLDKAFDSFFKRIKQGRKPGHPRFKSRDRFNSFQFDCSSHGGGCKVVGRKLRLQHIGTIRLKWHRELPDGAQIKSARIVRDGDKWFVCFSIEMPGECPPSVAPSVGIDVGLRSFVSTSDGEELGDSKSLERALPELRRGQRALCRCVRGSNRRRLARRRVAELHRKVRESRRDMHHKVARSLVGRYGTIAAESLDVQGMLKNRRLARRISDAGWYSFLQILAYKAEGAGARVILVDPKYTSQQCSNCGEIVRKSLAVRVHKCDCGCVLDRDVNAAINILGRAVPEAVKVGSPTLA